MTKVEGEMAAVTAKLDQILKSVEGIPEWKPKVDAAIEQVTRSVADLDSRIGALEAAQSPFEHKQVEADAQGGGVIFTNLKFKEPVSNNHHSSESMAASGLSEEGEEHRTFAGRHPWAAECMVVTLGTTFQQPEFWVKVTGVEGLDRSTDAVTAPIFNFTLRVNYDHGSLGMPVCGKGGSVVVAYAGVPMAHCALPEFCAWLDVVASVPIVATSEGLGLPGEAHSSAWRLIACATVVHGNAAWHGRSAGPAICLSGPQVGQGSTPLP
ncbi:hypothetical protein EJB05_16839, partial [Eragrostis curvula]